MLERELSRETLQEIRKLECPVPDVMPYFLRGGYPEPALSADDFAYGAWMENYFRTYVDRDIRKLFPRLDAIRYRRFVRMLSSLSGTVINKAQLGRSVDVSEVTPRRRYAVAMPIFFFSSASASAPALGEGSASALSMSSSMVPPTSASWS